jgi:membrane protease YdiL (CAAX protease family)
MLQNLAQAWGLPAGLLISSVLFALGHLMNPGSGLLPIIGLSLAGLLMAIGYVVTRRLWLPIGLHLSWNFVQGPIFGFPVSGLPTPSLLRLERSGAPLLTGGEFGPEASLIGAAASLLGIVMLLAARREDRTRPSRV